MTNLEQPTDITPYFATTPEQAMQNVKLENTQIKLSWSFVGIALFGGVAFCLTYTEAISQVLQKIAER